MRGAIEATAVGKAPAISVVIATHNRARSLAETLRALAAQTLPGEQFEVIVVSDGSTDETEAVVTQCQRQLGEIIYLSQRRRGPAAARNAGIARARGRLVAFTDDDCIPDREWLRRIAECFRDHPKALGVEGRTITGAGETTPLTHQVVNLRGGRSRPTCNVCYRREALVGVGGFDEAYVFNGEDEEMALAVEEMGQIVFCESATVVHPPRRLSFCDHLLRIARLERQAMVCEFRLARKHPSGYRRLRGGGRWRSIFYVTARLRLCDLWEGRGWLRRAPSLWLGAALLLGIKMLYRAALVPVVCLKLWSDRLDGAGSGRPRRASAEPVTGTDQQSLAAGAGGGW